MKLLPLLLIISLAAADKPAPKSVTLSKEDLLVLQKNAAKIQVLQMKIQMVQAQANQDAAVLFAEDNEVIGRACKAASIDVKECDVSTETGLVSKKAPVTAAVKPAPVNEQNK